MSFHNAPVTKGIMMAIGGGSLAAALLDVKYLFNLQLVPHLSRDHQYWRLLSNHLIAGNSSDLLLAEVLLYSVAINIERTFGSSKFASFLIVSTIVSTILTFLVILILHYTSDLNVIPPGPLTILFSILYQHHRIVPASYHFKISYLDLTNKSFMYFLALLLMISNPPPTVITATVGLLTGYLYRSDITGLKTYRVSRRLRAFSRQFLLPLIGSTPPPRRSNIALPNEVSRTSSQRREGEGTPGANANATSQTPTEVPPTVEPGTRRSVVSQWVSELATGAEGVRPTTETEISALMDMFPGLRREEAVSALQRSSDIQAAANVILQRQG